LVEVSWLRRIHRVGRSRPVLKMWRKIPKGFVALEK